MSIPPSSDGLDEILRAYRGADHWSTPSLVPAGRPSGFRDDQSISNSAIGSLLEHSNAVLSLEERTAHARGAKRAWVLINGSTGGNQVVLLALALSQRSPTVLVAGNSHHSILNAAIAFGVSLRFLPTFVIPAFDAMLPPTAEDVRSALDRDPSITAVIVTSPTYEGLHADVRAIAEVVHQRGLPLIVDAAWGAHFGYHPTLPPQVTTTGADVVVESLHKTGGAAQGCAAILYAGTYLHEAAIEQSYAMLTTTSPSFPLLATIESALSVLTSSGEKYLQVPIDHASRLREGLRERGLPVLEHDLLVDVTKVTFGAVDGFLVNDLMAKRGVIIEKASCRTALMLATMQLRPGAAERALSVIDEILPTIAQQAAREPDSVDVPSDEKVRVAWLTHRPLVEPSEAMRGFPTETVPTGAAVGRVAGEIVELYPPGVPVLAPGWEIRAEALNALEQARAAGGRIVARDRSLNTVLVLR